MLPTNAATKLYRQTLVRRLNLPRNCKGAVTVGVVISEREARVLDYADDILKYSLRRELEQEHLPPDFLCGFPPHARRKMVDLLCLRHSQLGLSTEVFFLAVRICDAHLFRRHFEPDDVHALVSVATWLACKFEQTARTPSMEIVTRWSGIDRSVVLLMERLMITDMNFCVSHISPLSFVKFLMQILSISNDVIFHSSLYICEMFSLDAASSSSRPSRVAGAAVYLSHALTSVPITAVRIGDVLGASETEIEAHSGVLASSVLASHLASNCLRIRRKYAVTVFNRASVWSRGQIVKLRTISATAPPVSSVASWHAHNDDDDGDDAADAVDHDASPPALNPVFRTSPASNDTTLNDGADSVPVTDAFDALSIVDTDDPSSFYTLAATDLDSRSESEADER